MVPVCLSMSIMEEWKETWQWAKTSQYTLGTNSALVNNKHKCRVSLAAECHRIFAAHNITITDASEPAELTVHDGRLRVR